MADQATMNDGNRVQVNAPMAEGVVGNLAEFGNDIMTLAELQAKLAVIDLKDGVDRALWPTGIALGSLTLALASLPVLLFGAGWLVAHALTIDEGWGLVIVGLSALVLGGIGTVLAGLRLPTCFESFRRSQEELTRNLAWIKTVLVYSGRRRPRSRNRR